MSDRRPTDDELLLEALEATRAGNGAAAAATARLAHDKALQAELDGLRAVQDLLKADADWGAQSGADAPPPHLLDAILRAEVAARPDAIRSAVAANPAVGGAVPAPPATGWWSRFSSWVVGGGVVVGAAAALLVTVSRAPADVAAPKAEAAPTAAPAPALQAAPPPPADVVATMGDGPAEDRGTAAGGVRRLREEKKPTLATAMPVDGQAGKADKALDDSPAHERSIGGLGGVADLDDDGAARPDADAFAYKDAAPGSVARAGDAPTGLAAASSGGGRAMPAEAESPPPEPPAAEPMPAATAPAAPAPRPAPVRVVSADEARKNFLAARAKAEAKEQAKEQAKAVAEAKGKAKTAPAAAKKSARDDADAAREQMAREQRLQEANSILVTAERELQFGRFAVALDLAQQAEAIAGTGLGLAPASTQTRAFLGLKRFADAARVASRLLSGSAASPQLVDGMLAGAEAASAIGDLRLAERLLAKAASTENPDAARRTEARRRLQALSGNATAPAKAKASEAAPPPATTSSDAP
jgi:hypothetical protein